MSVTAARTEVRAESARESLHAREWLFLVVLVGLLCVSWLRGIHRGEVYLMTDETRHAMNGVLVLDFLRDLPWRWPLQYAYEYYGKYPAVAVGHWPPAFYFVEAVFFQIFGIAPWVSRLAILPFSILAAVFCYKIVRCFARPELAWVSALIYACLPSIFLYEQTTMLEIPVLALCLGAIYSWLSLLRAGSKSCLYATAFFSAWALLTKQTAVFLVLLFMFHLILERKWALLRWKHTYFALAGTAILVVPWYVMALKIHPTALHQAVGSFRRASHLYSAMAFDYYPKRLVSELGLPLLILGLVGILLAMRARDKQGPRFLLTWIVACYLALTPISDKAPRYMQPLLLPFVFFAVFAVWQMTSHWRRWAMIGLAGLAASFYVPSLFYERPYVEGCEEAARYLSQQPGSDLLFYQGALNGDFIFFVRKFDPEKRRCVLRERMVGPVAVSHFLGQPEQRKRDDPPTPAEIAQVFTKLGVRYIVMDTGEFSPEMRNTYLALQSDKFELLKEIPVQTNDYRVAGVKLLIYRPKEPATPKMDEIEIPMTSLRHNLRLPLSDIVGHPWPAFH